MPSNSPGQPNRSRCAFTASEQPSRSCSVLELLHVVQSDDVEVARRRNEDVNLRHDTLNARRHRETLVERLVGRDGRPSFLESHSTPTPAHCLPPVARISLS